MARQLTGFLLLAWSLVEASSGLQHLKQGDSVTLKCPINVITEGAVVRIFKYEQKVTVFTTTSTFPRLYIFNDTGGEITLEPSLESLADHFTMEHTLKGTKLTIKNVTVGDSGKWGCEIISLSTTTVPIDELVIEGGPIYDLYWTYNVENLTDPLPEGADIFLPQSAGSLEIYCVVVVSRTEPKMELSMGPFGKEGSRNLKNWQNGPRTTIHSFQGGGEVLWYNLIHTVGFQISLTLSDFQRRQPLYMRASTPSTTLEKSIRPRIKEPPPDITIKRYTRPGRKDVQITSEIYIYPIPTAEWTLGNGERVSANTPIDGYRVEDKVTDAGYFSSSLTIADVTDADFGKLTVKLTNELGSGNTEVILVDGDEPTSQSGRSTTSLHLLLSLLLVPLINLLLPAI